MNTPQNRIEMRSILVDLCPSQSRPRGWIDFTITLDPKPLDAPLSPGMNELLRITGTITSNAGGDLAEVLKETLSRHSPQPGLKLRLRDKARRGFLRRSGYSLKDVSAIESALTAAITDIEATCP